MDQEKLKQKITALLKIAKISDEEKKFLLEKLPTSTPEQLTKLEDNLHRQIAVDAHLEALEKLEKDDKILTSNDYQDMEKEIATKLLAAQDSAFTQTEIADIRSKLATLVAGTPKS